MPFDVQSFDLSQYTRIIHSGEKVTIRRRAALDMYAAAIDGGPSVDWRAVAGYLADMIPQPKAETATAPISTSSEDGGEWQSYSDAQGRGRGKSFHSGKIRDVPLCRWRASFRSISHIGQIFPCPTGTRR